MDNGQDADVHGPWASLYGQVLDALETLVGGCTPELAARTVPATPAWTVQQVIAHLAGSAADVTTGRMDGAPRESWTQRHVAEREAVPIDELLAELRSTQRSFGIIAEGASAAVFNAVVHHADLLEALDAPRQDAGLYLPILEQQRPRWEALSLRLPGDPDVPGTREVDPYLLSRALFTRLDRRQLRDLAGTGPTDGQLDGFGLFGPPAEAGD